MKEDYKEISDYGAIGNLRTVALSGRDGSIDWACFPEIDNPSTFAAILDNKKGGRFRVSPLNSSSTYQKYLGDTNSLETGFKRNGSTILTVRDLMPLSGNINGREAAKSQSLPEIYRCIECISDEEAVEVEWSPRFDYGRSRVKIEKRNGSWIAKDGKNKMVLSGAVNGEVKELKEGSMLIISNKMKKGEKKVLVTRFNSENAPIAAPEDFYHKLDETEKSWHEWVHLKDVSHSKKWAGEWMQMVIRSELVFKMLINSDTGSFAAAPTTSLPETIGGARNWDYRFAWLRDASMTAQALLAVGHEAEASDYVHWLEEVTSKQFEEGLPIQVMYGLRGQTELSEHELQHFEGYKNSSPVRIGNEAAKQLQLETYGEVINTAYELERRGERLKPHIRTFLKNVTEYVCNIWKEPDHGIWELRSGRQHLVYSKVMAWVTFDRAVMLAEKYGLEGNVEKWKKTRNEVRNDILANGFNKEMNSFVQAYGSEIIDASNLRIPLLEFLPFDDPRIQGTINMIKEQLSENGFIYRYLMDDGLPGKEGSFNLCTFWLVDCLAMSGRIDEAMELFEKMLMHANHLGLYSEQLDPSSGRFLGNFPQAFTHIGFINSAIYLAYALGRKVPEHTLTGTPSHRKYAGR